MNQNTPLARGFCDGIRPPEDELTASDLTLPTHSKAVSMKCRPNSIASTAVRLGVTARTVSRYRAAGVNTDDAVDIARHLTAIQNPSPAALRAVNRLLAAELSHLTK